MSQKFGKILKFENATFDPDVERHVNPQNIYQHWLSDLLCCSFGVINHSLVIPQLFFGMFFLKQSDLKPHQILIFTGGPKCDW